MTAPAVDPCAGHECDHCARCQKGRCCRGDNPDYRLPAVGDWDGPIYGEIGQTREDGATMECHCCGGWYVSLAQHAVMAHGLYADEYRAIFGLMRQHGLLASERRRQRSDQYKRLYREGKIGRALIPATPEIRSKAREAASRPRRERKALYTETSKRSHDTIKARKAADPAYAAALLAKRRASHPPTILEHRCVICLTVFRDGLHGRRATCSAACQNELRRRVTHEARMKERTSRCKRDLHDMTEDNILWHGDRRRCRACQKACIARYNDRQRAAKASGAPP